MTYGTVVVCGGGCYGGYYVRQLARAMQAGAIACERVLVVDQDPACPVSQLVHAASSADDDGIARHAWPVAGGTGARDIAAYRALPLAFEQATWSAALARVFADAIADGRPSRDAVVPSPLMPNLLADWVASRLATHRIGATTARVPLPAPPETPWQRTAPDGSHYASFATWMCPINCIEPARCPETRSARDWSMPVAVQRAASGGTALREPYDVVARFVTTHRAYGVGMFDVESARTIDAALARVAAAPAVSVLVASMSHCHGAFAALRSVRG